MEGIKMKQYEKYIIEHDKGTFVYHLIRHAYGSYKKAKTAKIYGVTERGEKDLLFDKQDTNYNG